MNTHTTEHRGRASDPLTLVAFCFATAMMICLADACGSSNNSGGSSSAPPQGSCAGQSELFIDPTHNIGYVPIFALDSNGNAQLDVVNLKQGVSNPIIKTLSLPGSNLPVGIGFNPNNHTILEEAASIASGQTSGPVTIYEIDTSSQSVSNTVAATGLIETYHAGLGNPTAGGGGLVENFKANKAIVAGSQTVGVLDTSTDPPTWDSSSVIGLSDFPAGSFPFQPFLDSISVNSNTGIMFASNDGGDDIIDTSSSALTPALFFPSVQFGITDGNAFDIGTNILILSQEVGADQSWAFNFATLDTSSSPASADYVQVPGLGEAEPIGEGPGGQAAVNCATHQATIADEFGQNLKLVHMPSKPVPGAFDNNGQPGSATTADAASVYTIAGAIIPKGDVGGTPTQLEMVADPGTEVVDNTHNLMYALAAPNYVPQAWNIGSTGPLFLIRVDLSKPVLGACPVCAKQWLPDESALPLQ